MLSLVNFPFIMNFIRTYKDDYQVYFLLEYIKGMELFDVIREIGILLIFSSFFSLILKNIMTTYLKKNDLNNYWSKETKFLRFVNNF